MPLSKIPKLFVSSNMVIGTPEGYDRAWTIHEALVKIDLINYTHVRVDMEITGVYTTEGEGVTLDAATVEDYARDFRPDALVEVF